MGAQNFTVLHPAAPYKEEASNPTQRPEGA